MLLLVAFCDEEAEAALAAGHPQSLICLEKLTESYMQY